MPNWWHPVQSDWLRCTSLANLRYLWVQICDTCLFRGRLKDGAECPLHSIILANCNFKSEWTEFNQCTGRQGYRSCKHNTQYKTNMVQKWSVSSPIVHCSHHVWAQLSSINKFLPLIHLYGIWYTQAALTHRSKGVTWPSVGGERIRPRGRHSGGCGRRSRWSWDRFLGCCIVHFLLTAVRGCKFGWQQPFFLSLFLLHPPVLEPNFHLSLIELQRGCNFYTARPGQVLVEVEFLL